MKEWSATARAVALGVFGVLVFLPTANAQDTAASMPWKKAGISIGLSVPFHQSELGIDSQTLGRGTDVDLEDDLGLDSRLQTGFVEAFWRVAPRHKVEFSYTDMSRDNTRTINRTLQIKDKTYTVGASLTTEIDLNVYRASYAYSFWQDETLDIAAKLGVFVMDAGFSFTAPGIGRETENVLAPLPTIGLEGSYAITPRLFFRAGAQFFKLSVDDTEGTIVDTKVAIEYDIFEHVSVGTGYQYTNIGAELDDDNKEIRLDYGWGAVMVYLKFFI